jgi:prepilin-type N-terminal cleavage/methylation domain-containing protein
MPRRNNNAYYKTTAARGGFTLVELILVMVVMVTILAFIAPILGRTFKQRGLDQEAVRMLALTEYGRDEAVSQGVPTQVWIDPIKGNFGVEAMPDYQDDKGNSDATATQGSSQGQVREKQFSLPADVHFELSSSTHTTAEGYEQVIQFDPDGTPTTGTGIASIRIVDKDNGSSELTLATDGWSYEITKGGQNASQAH